MANRSSYDSPPPSKASLLKWWRAFTKHSPVSRTGGTTSTTTTTTTTAGVPHAPYQAPGRGLPKGKSGEGRVFGVSPEQSLKYASVAISMVGQDGKPYVYGYVPIVVAKCGMMLKETATQTEGIFRVSGSNKRINQLQALFDEPPTYGKDLDWTGYSVHDAASVLRRYLNQMPEPVIPANLYLDFTAVLQRNFPESESIAAYQHLITLLPPSSRWLLLYLLDFLSVFVRSSEANLMTASNLAVVFQPGLVSTRREGTGRGGAGGEGALLGFPGFVGGQVPASPSLRPSSPAAKGSANSAMEGAGEHGRGKEVLEFLIEFQHHFMMGLEAPLLPHPAPPPPRIGDRRQREEDSGYGGSGSSPSSSGGLASVPSRLSSVGGGGTGSQAVAGPSTLGGAAGGVAVDLARRGSEKSVERRRLRKSQEGQQGGKVKRSRTLPGGRSGKKAVGTEGEGSPVPGPSASLDVPSTPSGGLFSGRPRKGRRSAGTSPSPSPSPSPTPTVTPALHQQPGAMPDQLSPPTSPDPSRNRRGSASPSPEPSPRIARQSSPNPSVTDTMYTAATQQSTEASHAHAPHQPLSS